MVWRAYGHGVKCMRPLCEVHVAMVWRAYGHGVESMRPWCGEHAAMVWVHTAMVWSARTWEAFIEETLLIPTVNQPPIGGLELIRTRRRARVVGDHLSNGEMVTRQHERWRARGKRCGGRGKRWLERGTGKGRWKFARQEAV